GPPARPSRPPRRRDLGRRPYARSSAPYRPRAARDRLDPRLGTRRQGRRRHPRRARKSRIDPGRDEIIEPSGPFCRQTCRVRTPAFRPRRGRGGPARGPRPGPRAGRAGAGDRIAVPARGPVVHRGPRLRVFFFALVVLVAFVGLTFTAAYITGKLLL